MANIENNLSYTCLPLGQNISPDQSQLNGEGFLFGDHNVDEAFYNDLKHKIQLRKDPIDTIRKLRIERVKQTRQNENIFGYFVDRYDSLKPRHSEESGECQHLTHLKDEVSEVLWEIIKNDFDSYFPGNTGSARTVLHDAAERGFSSVVEKIVGRRSSACLAKDEKGAYPLLYALQELDTSHDESAALLVRHMPNKIVRDFFDYNDVKNGFSLKTLFTSKMKKTIKEYLDCLIDPGWSHLLHGIEREEIENMDMPWNTNEFVFHFKYLEENESKMHKKSRIQYLLENPNNDNTILCHPVILMIGKLKWKKYCSTWIDTSMPFLCRPVVTIAEKLTCGKSNKNKFNSKAFKAVKCFFAALGLLMVSFAFLSSSSSIDRWKYESTVDFLRLFCEIAFLIGFLIMAYSELLELFHHKSTYFKKGKNYVDLIWRILFVIIVIARLTFYCRLEFYISSIFYFTFFIRMFYDLKYISKTMSVYFNSLVTVIHDELPKFFGIFVMYVIAFSGLVFLAFKGNFLGQMYSRLGVNISLPLNQSYSLSQTYSTVFTKEILSIVEGKEYGELEDYQDLEFLLFIFIILNMLFGIVVINNIFIGQVTYAYENALTNAKEQYYLDRLNLLTYKEVFGNDIRKRIRLGEQCLHRSLLEKKVGEDWWDNFNVKFETMEEEIVTYDELN